MLTAERQIKRNPYGGNKKGGKKTIRFKRKRQRELSEGRRVMAGEEKKLPFWRKSGAGLGDVPIKQKKKTAERRPGGVQIKKTRPGTLARANRREAEVHPERSEGEAKRKKNLLKHRGLPKAKSHQGTETRKNEKEGWYSGDQLTSTREPRSGFEKRA